MRSDAVLIMMGANWGFYWFKPFPISIKWNCMPFYGQRDKLIALWLKKLNRVPLNCSAKYFSFFMFMPWPRNGLDAANWFLWIVSGTKEKHGSCYSMLNILIWICFFFVRTVTKWMVNIAQYNCVLRVRMLNKRSVHIALHTRTPWLKRSTYQNSVYDRHNVECEKLFTIVFPCAKMTVAKQTTTKYSMVKWMTIWSNGKRASCLETLFFLLFYTNAIKWVKKAANLFLFHFF